MKPRASSSSSSSLVVVQKILVQLVVTYFRSFFIPQPTDRSMGSSRAAVCMMLICFMVELGVGVARRESYLDG